MWPPIELRQIRVFLAVAQELHFGRAADKLGLTQSRVSQMIRTLESQVGGRLFDRTSRHAALTPVGEELRRQMAPAYEQILQGYAHVHELATGVAGTVRLGLPYLAVGGPHLVEIVKTFEARHPDCQVLLTETGFVRAQCEWLRSDELDLLALRVPFSHPDLVPGPVLSSEERVLVVASGHPLATRGSVSVEDLADYVTTDIVTLPREIEDALSPPRTPSGRAVRRVRVQSVADAIVQAASGEVVHPSVPSTMDQYRQPGLAAVPIHDLPCAQTALMWLKGRDGLRVRAFAQAAADVVRSRGGPGHPALEPEPAR